MAENLWVEQYRCELDKDDRKVILEKAIEEEGLTEANELRRQFYEIRYEKNKGMEVDRFIRGWMELSYIQNEKNGFFNKNRVRKALDSIRSDFNLKLASEHGEVGRQVLYDEFYNAARLYMNLCEDDKSYNSIILGLGRMSKEKLLAKIAADLYKVAYEIPEEMGLEEELTAFREALTEAFCDAHSKNKDVLLDRIRAHKEQEEKEE